MTRCLTAVFLVLLTAMWTGAAASEEPVIAEYGPRPPQSVYDPAGFLDEKAMKEIADPLAAIYRKEGIDVIVVILPDLGGAPPDLVGRRFAAAWCVSQMHAVVLHVPGNKDGPWIIPAGELVNAMKTDVLARDISESKRRASYEPTEAGKVRAAAIEASDRLRYWKGSAINRGEYLKDARARIMLEQEEKTRRRNIVVLTAVAAAIPLLLLASAGYLKFRDRGPRKFPEVPVSRRLGAPHAGGNHLVVHLGVPSGRTQS